MGKRKKKQKINFLASLEEFSLASVHFCSLCATAAPNSKPLSLSQLFLAAATRLVSQVQRIEDKSTKQNLGPPQHTYTQSLSDKLAQKNYELFVSICLTMKLKVNPTAASIAQIREKESLDYFRARTLINVGQAQAQMPYAKL